MAVLVATATLLHAFSLPLTESNSCPVYLERFLVMNALKEIIVTGIC